MDSHITGPWKAGYGAMETTRGKTIDFDTPAGEYEIGVIQASEEKPVLVELILTDDVAFDGTTPNVQLIAAKESDPGTTQNVSISDELTGYTTNNPDTVRFVARENWRIYVEATPAVDGTEGRVTAVVRASGLGEIPLTV